MDETILLDHGYHPDTIQQALEQLYPEIMKIQFEVATKLSKTEKAVQGQSGFVPIAVRWVYAFGRAKSYERSNSWVERCKPSVNANN